MMIRNGIETVRSSFGCIDCEGGPEKGKAREKYAKKVAKKGGKKFLKRTTPDRVRIVCSSVEPGLPAY